MSAGIHAHELIADLFAGGGGASMGIELALGRSPDIAINHSPAAIAMHAVNHPTTRHYCENVWTVDPRAVCAGRAVGLLHASPDCTHHSRAKGGKPKNKKLRSLASVVIRWARDVRPRVIVLENVEEWLAWGPVDNEGQPIKAKAGRSFRCWLGKLKAQGYRVEWRILNAADYGAPTTRKRVFLVARCDGEAIVWPVPSHGRGQRSPWRAASEVIDWSIPTPSIFDRKKPLADATMRRIAAGVDRYVIKAARPFIVPVTHTKSGDRVHAITDPLRTVTTAKGGEFALVSPTLVQLGYGEREGQAPRALDITKPLGTVVAGGGKHGLVAALLTKHYGGVVGHGVQLPLGTITTQDHHALTTTFLTKFYGTSTGQDVTAPVPTVTAGGQHIAAVRAFLIKYYGASDRPESQQQGLFEPLHTVTTKARFGLVTVQGETYQIADIGMRMLSPRELFRAQSFPDSYVIDVGLDGRPFTKTAQIELAGNSVCPVVEQAVVGAQFHERPALRAAS